MVVKDEEGFRIWIDENKVCAVEELSGGLMMISASDENFTVRNPKGKTFDEFVRNKEKVK